MATKRKSSAKKGSKKSAKKTSKKAAATFPPINLKCIEACVARFNICRSKGVPLATCVKRLQRCIANCQGGIFPTTED
ncbi:MAG TPA: hypothetical protein VNG71_21385 [Pyrinomonadaceae bacterium]|nr:hypothetical protein [Pyrinomonadaceae bacterium]